MAATAVLGGAATVANALLPESPPESPSATTPGAAQQTVSLTLGTRHPGTPVPTDFLGLSFEAEAVPRLAGYRPGSELDTLLRSLGHGVIRVGGVSADKSSAWEPAGAPRAAWASTALSPADVARLAALVRRVGWRALWTIGLGHYEPARAAREAAAAWGTFGPDLLGLEVGNEPNAYVGEGLRAPGWGLPLWRQQFAAYRRAIAHAAPGAPIASPDASSGVKQLAWVRAAALARPRLLTDHYYSLTSCGYQRPSIAELLGAPVREAETTMLEEVQAIVPARRTAIRIDETNNVSCHGEAGVSNSFASALWAVDWIARSMSAGIAGLNFHDLLDEPSAYSPIVLRDGRLHAHPEWYALLMTAPLAGQQPLRDVSTGTSTLTAAAFLAPRHAEADVRPGTLSIVLDDFEAPGTPSLTVRIGVPARYRSGRVLRLSAPGPGALSHVTLGGREVGPSGRWAPKLPLPHVRVARGSFTLAMKPSSAALITLSPR